MVKIQLPTFQKALQALETLRQNMIHASYWPLGGKTAMLSIPITHNVAINQDDYERAKQLIEAL